MNTPDKLIISTDEMEYDISYNIITDGMINENINNLLYVEKQIPSTPKLVITDILYNYKNNITMLIKISSNRIFEYIKSKNELFTDRDIISAIVLLKKQIKFIIICEFKIYKLKSYLDNNNIKSGLTFIDYLTPNEIINEEYNSEAKIKFISNYFWVIPNLTLINNITLLIQNNLTLEINSGLGLISAFLKANGCNIIPTDFYQNEWINNSSSKSNFIEIEQISPIEAVHKYLTDYLIIYWSHHDEINTIEAIKIYKGKYIIYFGELDDESCINQSLYESLHKNFYLSYKFKIKNWYKIENGGYIFKKKE